jgi:hypothetical protein
MNSLSKRKRRRRENKELTQMTKSQRKAKTRSFENEQNLVPKDMGNSSTQISKTKLALKKRQRAQHH